MDNRELAMRYRWFVWLSVASMLIGGIVYLTALKTAASNVRPPVQTTHQNLKVKPASRSVAPPDLRIAPELLSDTVRHVCGLVPESAERYELRNDALRSIARLRDLPEADVLALMGYVAATNGSLRVEREAALKNDVLNLLVDQNPVPDGLADLLIGMVAAGNHPPVILDYCIQHLGALYADGKETATLNRIRAALVAAARDVRTPCAGTALYALAARRGQSTSERDELRRLTVAALDPKADSLVRISALQLAGEKGWREALPVVRGILTADRRDAVTDTVAVGTLGLLGDEADLPLLDSVSARGGQRLKTPVESARKRIMERSSK